MTSGLQAIAIERARQAERWPVGHDDNHSVGELAKAAECYLMTKPPHAIPPGWPFEAESWKPGERIRNLEKAGALIAAEIERLHRAQTVRKTICTCADWGTMGCLRDCPAFNGFGEGGEHTR